ncbi:MAG: glycerate kinase [Bacteroidales bacterium]|nr:glycerate kinase [Bacteroidales bacterium]
MKVLLAFDSYKGCLTASQVCEASAVGIRKVYADAEVVSIPLSDGGEGMVDCVVRCGKADVVRVKVHGPLMEDVLAEYAISNDGTTAFIEMACACGLPLVPSDKRQPMHTTTYGFGELLLHARQKGVRRMVLGIGGSATCDGGVGMLQALSGVKPSDVLPPSSPMFPGCVSSLCADALSGIQITVACDVRNPLYGPEGAAYVFAPQKGATPSEVAFLDEQLQKLALYSQQMGVANEADAFRPGTGAAGGLGYALLTYLKAELMPGIDLMLDALRFEDEVRNGVDLILTGEGCSDCQTLMGKVPLGVLKCAQKHKVPVVLLSGQLRDDELLANAGFSHILSINAHDHRPVSVLMQPDVAMLNISFTVESLFGSMNSVG